MTPEKILNFVFNIAFIMLMLTIILILGFAVFAIYMKFFG